MKQSSYEAAGVDIELGNRAMDTIKSCVAATHSSRVLNGIGLFSGFFDISDLGCQHPVLVSSIDGVGTKVKVAEMAGVFDTIGVDLVNHCINDIAVCGAEPLFFLDYIAADKLELNVVQGIVTGMANACRQAGCALIGGETAEMPGVYAVKNFDVAGSIVGVVEKGEIIDGSAIASGDVLLGISSSGLHTNGFSLAREVLFNAGDYQISSRLTGTQSTLGEVLLKPHKCYLDVIRCVKRLDGLHGIAHITGGGVVGNTSRLLSDTLATSVEWGRWSQPDIFSFIQEGGNISDEEMRKVFNLGVGLVLVVANERVENFLQACVSVGEQAFVIGSIQAR